MARYVPKTYKNGRAARIVLTVFVSIILAAVILTVSLFFGLRTHVVYTPDGPKLDFAWLEETAAPEPNRQEDAG
ncbi:MAG: hypothetical protein LBT12_03535 [Oscillospiraceae bacterium]|jgi:hypothetical protein|nr:hypothetical protein [Oscillospiraceae bacterium]